MHKSVINLNKIQSLIKANQEKTNNKNNVKIIAVSKTFEISHIIPLIEYLSSILPKKIEARVEKIKKRDKALDNWVCEASRSLSNSENIKGKQ